jgi:hypothetical protein
VRAHGGEIRLVEGTIGATLRLTIPDRAVELSAHRGARIDTQRVPSCFSSCEEISTTMGIIFSRSSDLICRAVS